MWLCGSYIIFMHMQQGKRVVVLYIMIKRETETQVKVLSFWHKMKIVNEANFLKLLILCKHLPWQKRR